MILDQCIDILPYRYVLQIPSRWSYVTHITNLVLSRVEEFTGLVQDRIASEFSRLQYLMSLNNQHAMINSLQPVSGGYHNLQWLPWLQ